MRATCITMNKSQQHKVEFKKANYIQICTMGCHLPQVFKTQKDIYYLLPVATHMIRQPKIRVSG